MSQHTEAQMAAAHAFMKDEVAELRRLLEAHPELKASINDPVGPFDSPAITRVRSKAMLDLLLEYGADIDARSKWWAGGFGLLDTAKSDLAEYAIERGATVTVHAAARLGKFERLKELIEADPSLVGALGGDGQSPLHFASTVEIAEYLLAHGAKIDARDVDHESTAAQYMVKSRPQIARYLISRGAKTDLLMAAALGDLALAERLLREDPQSIRMRVVSEYFPMVGDGKSGGSIYQWELGWYVSAAQVAKSFGHDAMFQFLMDRSPAEEKLLNACWFHDEAMVRALIAETPKLAESLPAAGRRHVAHAARNSDGVAARLMLVAGLPAQSYSQHRASALHWASWHGNADLVRLLLEHGAELENAANDYGGTPLGWAMHGSQNGWFRDRGDYVAAAEALMDAGAKIPEEVGSRAKAIEVLTQRRSTPS